MPETIFVYKGGLQSVPKDVTRVKIDEFVQAIPNIAFKGCKKLKHLEFAKNSQLRVIGSFAFMDCIALEIVILPKTTKRIGCGAFANCTGIKVVLLQEGLEVIGLSSFKGCHNLMYASIPASVILMEPRAFANCVSLKEVAIENGQLSKIPDLAFDGCENLVTIGIPPSLATIGQKAIPKAVKQARNEWFSIAEKVENLVEKIIDASQQPETSLFPIVSPTQPSQDDNDDDSPASTQTTNEGALSRRRAVQVRLAQLRGMRYRRKSSETKDSATMTAPASVSQPQVTISLEQWKALNARLDALEKSTNSSIKIMSQSQQTLQGKLQTRDDNLKHQMLETKTGILQEGQRFFQTELDNLNSKYQSTLNELKDAKEERDDLKSQLSVMADCLEVLKKGFALLASREHPTKVEEFPLEVDEQSSSSKRPRSNDELLSVSSEEDEEPLDQRPKKRSRSISDAFLEIGNVTKKIANGIQWSW